MLRHAFLVGGSWFGYIAQKATSNLIILLYIALSGDSRVRQIQIPLDRSQAPILQSHIHARIGCRASAQSSATFARPEDEQWFGPRRGAVSANSDDTLCLKLGIASPKVRSFRCDQHYAAGLVTLSREDLFSY